MVRTATQRVKRWQKGDKRLRWIAAGLLAAEQRFRCARGYKPMGVLLTHVNAFDAKLAGESEAA